MPQLKRSFSMPVTEGWLELFLTPTQKNTFSRWQETVSNKSLTAKHTDTYFDLMAKYIPKNIAPNAISLSGFIVMANSWYIMSKYGMSFPRECTWFALLSIVFFFVTNSLDLKHADHIRQRTPLGELFKYSCDCASTVFLCMLTTYCVGGTSWVTQWYAVQTSTLIVFTKHLSAFHRQSGLRYNVLTGPGEVISAVILLLTIRGIFGLEWMLNLYGATLHKVVQLLAPYNLVTEVIEKHDILDKVSDPVELGGELMKVGYYSVYFLAMAKTLLLDSTKHSWSRFGISISLLMRIGPAVCAHMGWPNESSNISTVADGLFMSVLISDITLAKMSGREIHVWVVMMSFCSILSHSVILTMVAVYYIAIFGDLCHHTNMPLLTVCVNVYCDGVYDLCHIGHKNLFKRALGYGNRLFVGVCGDKDCANYKRPPIMTHDERCAEVEACKSVTKVIENAPCFGIDQEFLDKHQIHAVAFGAEYLERWPDPKDDVYYGYCRRLGIAHPMPRTPGLSTSDLIRRVQQSQPADNKIDLPK